jgi:hypothetical protein
VQAGVRTDLSIAGTNRTAAAFAFTPRMLLPEFQARPAATPVEASPPAEDVADALEKPVRVEAVP